MPPLRPFAVGLAATAFVLALAGPLVAQTAEPAADRSFVVFTGKLDVAEGDVFRDAVIFDGDAAIAGQVVSNVVAFNGDITVSGTVGEDVVALNGRVTVASGAQIGGDVASRDGADVAEGATVGGVVTSQGLPTDFDLGQYATVSRIAIWIATSVSSLVLGLLLLLFAPRAGEAVAATATERLGRSIGIGFAVFFGVPIAGFIAFVTLIGIPLGAGILLGLALLFWVGYVAAALAIGRQLVRPPTSRLLAFLAGWTILRVAAIVPEIGGIVWFLATVFGLGALAVAARAAGRDGRQADPAVARDAPAGVLTMPPPPPLPPDRRGGAPPA
jgi:hypothetical protein